MPHVTRSAHAWRPLALAIPLVVSAGLLATPAATAAPSSTRQADRAATTRGWFHDPLTAAQRSALVPIPARPKAVHGKVRGTQALYRTAAGALAVPAGWARGHQLTKGQAVVLDGPAIVGRRTTSSTRQQVAQLAASLTYATAVRCEGYSTYGVPRSRAQKLALQRAVRVCNLLAGAQHGPRATSVGYGATRPVLVGGRKAQRTRNDRVVVSVVTARTATAGKPPAHQSSSPGAPGLTTVLGGLGTITLTFTPPSSTGGSPITGYQWSTDRTSWSPLTVSGSAPYSVQLDALPAGTATYYVRALNAVGAGAPSTGLPGTVTGLPVPPVATVPGAPTLSSVTGGLGTMLLGLTAPVSDGGSTITGYQWSTDLTTWNALPVTGSSPYSALLSSLPVGSLTYYVRAVNAIGPGAASGGLLGLVQPPLLVLTPPVLSQS